MTMERPISVLVASSGEARTIARLLRDQLPTQWATTLWDEQVMTPGSSPWEGLIGIGQGLDAAILLLTADDIVQHRGASYPTPRDNVVFEIGLFMGLLGPERALLVQPAGLQLKLPSDLEGITKILYPMWTQDSARQRSIDRAATQIEQSLSRLGHRLRDVPPTADHRRELDLEVDRLSRAAVARGWTITTDTTSLLCLSYDGEQPVEVRVGLSDAASARESLRDAALVLHKLGVRVAQDLLPTRLRRVGNQSV
jgi:hypothetical protein